jgi:hypothetical protein
MLTSSKPSGTSNICFETLGAYPILLPFLFFTLSLFIASTWIMYSLGVIMFGPLFVFTLITSVAKIEVADAGVIVRRLIYGTSYWTFESIELKSNGRIVVYGGKYGGWIMPLNWRQFTKAIKQPNH